MPGKLLPVDSSDDEVLTTDGRQSKIAAEIQRGVSRLLLEMGYTPLTELTLKTGRRVDIAALNGQGEIIVVEIKSSVTDFRNDRKWNEYLKFCDRFFFAVAPDFPSNVLPETTGLMVADRYGGEILRDAERVALSPARRKMILLLFARAAATRVHNMLDSAG